MEKDFTKELELYKKMYCCLFNAITDVQKMESRECVVEYLKKKQCETEEMYISFGEVK